MKHSRSSHFVEIWIDQHVETLAPRRSASYLTPVTLSTEMMGSSVEIDGCALIW